MPMHTMKMKRTWLFGLQSTKTPDRCTIVDNATLQCKTAPSEKQDRAWDTKLELCLGFYSEMSYNLPALRRITPNCSLQWDFKIYIRPDINKYTEMVPFRPDNGDNVIQIMVRIRIIFLYGSSVSCNRSF
jgi:hypothetical protein